jgi:hypothetical protein
MSKTRTHASYACFVSCLFCLSIGLGACVYPTSMSFTETTRPSTPVTLSRLYVYSFLDLRVDELGSALMSEISRQLAAGLESCGVASEQHWFRDDPIAGQFARLRGSEVVPVRRVITQNRATERAYGSDYRLIVFPVQTTVEPGWIQYDFRWTLEDTRTNRIVWSTTSRGRHARGEDSEELAKDIVDGLITQMDVSGLLRAAAASTAAR